MTMVREDIRCMADTQRPAVVCHTCGSSHALHWMGGDDFECSDPLRCRRNLALAASHAGRPRRRRPLPFNNEVL